MEQKKMSSLTLKKKTISSLSNPQVNVTNKVRAYTVFEVTCLAPCVLTDEGNQCITNPAYPTCSPTCQGYTCDNTCQGNTCANTCQGYTCPNTCPDTCKTCIGQYTCNTCVGMGTCEGFTCLGGTCNGNTCADWKTCPGHQTCVDGGGHTCPMTDCQGSCDPTCGGPTCEGHTYCQQPTCGGIMESCDGGVYWC